MSHVWIPSKEEQARFKREALSNVRRMAFAPGTRFFFDTDGASKARYIVTMTMPEGGRRDCPLVAWGRHAWEHGHRPHIELVGECRWLRVAQLLFISRRAAHMIVAAAADFPLADLEIRAALVKKCGLE